MNQDTRHGHPAGTTPASGISSPTVVDSLGSSSYSLSVCSNLNYSSTAHPVRGCSLPSTFLTHGHTLTRAHTRSPNPPEGTALAANAAVTTTTPRATAALAHPRAALSATGMIHSVSSEPHHMAQGIQPIRWPPHAPPDLRSAVAIRPHHRAQATPMEFSVDAWPISDTRAPLPVLSGPSAQGPPPTPPGTPAGTLVPGSIRPTHHSTIAAQSAPRPGSNAPPMT